jgi:hypothetical protein
MVFVFLSSRELAPVLLTLGLSAKLRSPSQFPGPLILQARRKFIISYLIIRRTVALM